MTHTPSILVVEDDPHISALITMLLFHVFISSSIPNPARMSVKFNFTLSEAGPVSVEVFSADGRLVETVAKGEMTAGPQSIAWNLGRDTPSGMYFYRVVAGKDKSTGKFVRVD